MRHNTSHARHPRGRHATWRRAVVPAVMAGIAVLPAACGGRSASGPAVQLTAYQRELAYAECMRAHRDPGFPDPQSDGTFNTTTADANAFHGTQFQAANKACVHLEGAGVTPAQFQQNVRQTLRYAACMRAHGIAGFQASVQGTRITVGIHGPGSETNTPQFLAAQRTCRKLSPGGS